MAEGEVAFPNGKVWIDREHGILRVVFLPNTHHDLKSAEDELAAVARASGGKRYPALIDLGNVRAVTREARAYLAGPESSALSTAVALLSRSAVGNMLANVFLAVFGDDAVPTRLFSQEA